MSRIISADLISTFKKKIFWKYCKVVIVFNFLTFFWILTSQILWELFLFSIFKAYIVVDLLSFLPISCFFEYIHYLFLIRYKSKINEIEFYCELFEKYFIHYFRVWANCVLSAIWFFIFIYKHCLFFLFLIILINI